MTTIWNLIYDEEKRKHCVQELSVENTHVPNLKIESNIEDDTWSYYTSLIDAEHACDKVNNDIRSGILSIYKCKECGMYFYINANERSWFLEKGLSVPKRCPKCRKKRNKNKSE